MVEEGGERKQVSGRRMGEGKERKGERVKGKHKTYLSGGLRIENTVR